MNEKSWGIEKTMKSKLNVSTIEIEFLKMCHAKSVLINSLYLSIKLYVNSHDGLNLFERQNTKSKGKV